MKTKQTHAQTINQVRRLDNHCELYSEFYKTFSDMDLDEKIAPFLNAKLESGEIKSIADLSEFFLVMYRDCRTQAQKLVNELA